MEKDNVILNVLAHPSAYRVWQGPFAETKLRPFLENNNILSFRKVLDVGCGPGTNAAHVGGPGYLGAFPISRSSV